MTGTAVTADGWTGRKVTGGPGRVGEAGVAHVEARLLDDIVTGSSISLWLIVSYMVL